MPAIDDQSDARRGRLRRNLVIAALSYAAVVVLLLAIGLSGLRAAEGRLTAARAEITSAAAGDTTHPDLDAAHRGFARARWAFTSPLLAPLKVVPIAGRQLRSVSSLSEAAWIALDAGREGLDDAAQISSRPLSDGAARVRAAEDAAALAKRIRTRLGDLDFGPSRNLLAPIANRRQRFLAEVDRINELVIRAEVGATAMTKFLRGPTSYAVFGANNAEMRAGSGMYLTAGRLEVKDGELVLSTMRPIRSYPRPPDDVARDADFLRLWGPQSQGADYRFANMTPQFPTTGSMLKRMWETSGQPAVDGVLVVDPVLTANLVEAVGTQAVEGIEVTEQNALELLMHDQYVSFPSDDPTQRREFLGEVTAAVFSAVNSGKTNASRLGHALADAARGRHVLAWTEDQVVERGWVALGVDGQLSESSLLFALQNRGGNKLDYFQDIKADARVSVSRSGSDFEINFSITNTVKDGEPQYVAGPAPELFIQEKNLYVGIAALSLPKEARNISLTGGLYDLVAGPDGNSLVISQWVHISKGETITLKLRFTLPPRFNALDILPSARIPGVQWSAGDERWTDDQPRTVTW